MKLTDPLSIHICHHPVKNNGLKIWQLADFPHTYGNKFASESNEMYGKGCNGVVSILKAFGEDTNMVVKRFRPKEGQKQRGIRRLPSCDGLPGLRSANQRYGQGRRFLPQGGAYRGIPRT